MSIEWAGDSQVWANWATVAVILVAVVTFLVERKRVERAREEQAFEIVTTHYMRFLELAMENPDLTLAQLDTDKLPTELPPPPQDEEFERRDAILFELFYQVIEKVFVLYRASDLFTHRGKWDERKMKLLLDDPAWREREMKKSSNFRTRQWLGWDGWLADYAKSPVMREQWGTLDNDSTYDVHFMSYMDFRLPDLSKERASDA